MKSEHFRGIYDREHNHFLPVFADFKQTKSLGNLHTNGKNGKVNDT